MNDCINAEIRDLLPELVHDRLSAGDRTSVLAHVEACVDCQEELHLLREAKALFAHGVLRVDVAYVVGALPRAPMDQRLTRGRNIARSRPRLWSDWRVAAAVALLIAGGGSYAVLGTHRAGAAPDLRDTVGIVAMNAPLAGALSELDAALDAALDSAPVLASDLAEIMAPDDVRPAVVGSMDARLGDLTEDQLNVLLNDIDDLRAVPASEPASIALEAKMSLEDM